MSSTLTEPGAARKRIRRRQICPQQNATDDVLRHLPNVIATPHLGYVTEDSCHRFYGGAVEDIAAWLAGDPIRRLAPTED